MALLRLFAQAREAAGTNKVTLDAPTVGAVLTMAEAEFGDAFSQVVGGSKVWLNGAPAEPEDLVGPDDEVAVLPPVSGG